MGHGETPLLPILHVCPHCTEISYAVPALLPAVTQRAMEVASELSPKQSLEPQSTGHPEIIPQIYSA